MMNSTNSDESQDSVSIILNLCAAINSVDSLSVQQADIYTEKTKKLIEITKINRQIEHIDELFKKLEICINDSKFDTDASNETIQTDLIQLNSVINLKKDQKNKKPQPQNN